MARLYSLHTLRHLVHQKNEVKKLHLLHKSTFEHSPFIIPPSPGSGPPSPSGFATPTPARSARGGVRGGIQGRGRGGGPNRSPRGGGGAGSRDPGEGPRGGRSRGSRGGRGDRGGGGGRGETTSGGTTIGQQQQQHHVKKQQLIIKLCIRGATQLKAIREGLQGREYQEQKLSEQQEGHMTPRTNQLGRGKRDKKTTQKVYVSVN